MTIQSYRENLEYRYPESALHEDVNRKYKFHRVLDFLSLATYYRFIMYPSS